MRGLCAAVIREVKRGLCVRGIGEFDFRVSQFGPYTFRCGNRIEYFRAVEFGGEAEALGAFLFLLQPDDVVWDVGASIGLLSVHAAGLARQVVAFEPDPATFRRLRQHIELNGLSNRVECRMEALGDRTGDVVLRSDGLIGNAPAIADLGLHDGAVNARITTVDELVDTGLHAPTVLKIDVEGAELQMLRGAERLLGSARRPRIVFLEVHPQFLPRFGATVAAVERVVAQHDYHIAARKIRGDQIHLLLARR
jgi:FkbM family methyltransferase